MPSTLTPARRHTPLDLAVSDVIVHAVSRRGLDLLVTLSGAFPVQGVVAGRRTVDLVHTCTDVVERADLAPTVGQLEEWAALGTRVRLTAAPRWCFLLVDEMGARAVIPRD